MKDLSQYGISFPYGATSAPYSPSRPHRGDDRAAPLGTPVIVAGTQIGLVGSTGASTGNHCHTQEWNGSVGNVRKPQNTFKGGVVKAATQSSDFGNYVTIQTSDGWNDTYAHLSKITCSVGQVIGGDMPATKEELQVEYALAFPNQPINQSWVTANTGKNWSDVLNSLRDDPSRQAYITKLVNQSAAYENQPNKVKPYSGAQLFVKE